MSRPLDLARLHELCGRELPEEGAGERASLVVEQCGPNGLIWLHPQVVERALAWRREVNREPAATKPWAPPSLQPGQIGILLATHEAVSLPLLRPAFVLPVEWRQGGNSSPRLPAGLADEAARVLVELELHGLSLHLARWLEDAGADFSSLEFTTDSAWAALAAGATVASEHGVTLPDVMVSAAWRREAGTRQGRIGSVDAIAAKLAAAADGGARIVLLPQENSGAVEALAVEHPGRSLTIRYLANSLDTPQRAIADVLRALQSRPTRHTGAEFSQRSRYFVRMPQQDQNTYYRDELLAEIVDDLAPKTRDDPRLAGIDALIVIASPNWGIACLMVGLLDPDRVLLLHDARMKRDIEPLIASLRSLRREGRPERDVRSHEFPPDAAFPGDVEAAVTAFARDCTRIAVDLTAAYRHYAFTLFAALPGNGVATYVETRQDPVYRSVIPETAELHVVRMPVTPSANSQHKP